MSLVPRSARRAAPLLALLLAGALPGAAPAASQAPAAPDAPPSFDAAAPLPTDPAVTIGTLPNGIRYYIRVNREPQNRAELRLAVNAGSILEDERQRGLAHFVEHMAFNGTRQFARNELVGYLQSVGVQFGAHLNAYTGFDETVYILPLPTDTAGVVEKGVQILADWATGITFDDEQIQAERGVVLEEWRKDQGAGERIFQQQLPVLLRGSRYAERLPIGTRESLEAFHPDDLRRFYREWYRPDMMAVMAVGDFDPARMEALIRREFGQVPAADGARARPRPDVPGHTETLVSVVDDPEATNTQVQVYYKHPEQPVRTVGDFRRELADRLYLGMLNARLQEMTRKPDAPFVVAGSGAGGFARGAAMYSLTALVREGGVQRGLEAILTEARRVDRHGFTATELERARADLLRGAERAYAERDKTRSGAWVSQYVSHFLEGTPIPGPEATYALHTSVLPQVTLDEVNARARHWITDENRVVLVSGPRKEGVSLPAEGELLAVFDAVKTKEVEPYVDQVATGPLVETPPTPGRVVSEQALPEIGVTEWRLANGVRVVLKPTDFKADEIVFRGYSPGGSSLLPDSLYAAAGNAVLAVGAGGVGSMSETELEKALAGKAVSVSPYISSTEEGVSGGGSPKDLETLLQLTHLYLTAPRRDSTAFAAVQTQFRDFLRNRSASPEVAFQDTFTVTMAQHHPRSRPPSAALIDSIDLERSLAFYRDRFADAGDFTFVFVGSFDPDSLRPLVETYLGGLPAAGRQETWRDLGIRPPTGVVRREVRRGTEPKAMTRIAFTGGIDAQPAEVHALRSMTELLQIRLIERLREDLGGTYSPGVSWSVSTVPVEAYTVLVQFPSAPDRVDELVRTVFDEVERLRAEPAPEADLTKVREAQRRNLETALRTNGFWLGNLVSYDQRGWDPRAIPAGDELTAGIDAEAVRRAAARYLDPANHVLVTLVPETPAP